MHQQNPHLKTIIFEKLQKFLGKDKQTILADDFNMIEGLFTW